MGSHSSAYLGAILVVGHISHVMQAVLDLPMATVEAEHLFWRGFLRRKTRQAVRHLLGRFASFDQIAQQVGRGAPDAEDLVDMWEIDVVV